MGGLIAVLLLVGIMSGLFYISRGIVAANYSK